MEDLSGAKRVIDKMTKTIIGKLAAKISGVIVCGGLISLGITTSAQALTAGISDFTGVSQSNSFATDGFRFRAIQDLNVTALGVFDIDNDGLNATTVDVGLWDDSGTLLGSVAVSGGTNAPILNGFRYQNLGSSINLTSGNFYRVAADMTDISGLNSRNFVTASTLNGIDSVEIAFGPGDLSFPANHFGGGFANLGGNILFEDAVPVPFELSPNLGIIILGGIWGVSRLRKKRTKR
ncbi:hypothetical protein Xen7305DRAFT_00034280 [Xenococcus sp. PCC 7305]|nr:hypothetical protein Xen7305DRAFT_00034280 [Xenococcus sp. PCC 7305]